MGLSNLGIFHTVIGIIAIIAAIISYVRYGKINLGDLTGKIYFSFTIITSLTSLGISKRGGLNPGHAFAILIVILVVAAYFLHAKRPGNNRSRIFENFYLSLSFFFSWLPTINETFTRIPIGHPWAKGPADPLIAKTLLIVLVLFIVGAVYQIRQQRKLNKVQK